MRWPHKFCKRCSTVLPRKWRRGWCVDCVKIRSARFAVRDKAQHAVANSRKHAAQAGYVPISWPVERLADWLEKQPKHCAICLVSNKLLGIDHCHITGEVRGLLCTKCNTRLGALEDVWFVGQAKVYVSSSLSSSVSSSNTGIAQHLQL